MAGRLSETVKNAFEARLKRGWSQTDVDLRKQQQQVDLPAASNLGSL